MAATRALAIVTHELTIAETTAETIVDIVGKLDRITLVITIDDIILYKKFLKVG